MSATAMRSTPGAPGAGVGVGAGLLDLPDAVLLHLIASECSPSSRGVLLHVSKLTRSFVLAAGNHAAPTGGDGFASISVEGACESAPLVAWTAKQGARWSWQSFARAVDVAVERADVGVLGALGAIGCPLASLAPYAVATRSPRPDAAAALLDWLDLVSVPWRQASVCWAAAREDNLALLALLRARGCPWDWLTPATAALNGYRALLEWAVAEGCPLNATVCANAARSGSVEVLRLLRDAGCPWDARVLEAADEQGHTAVLLYAMTNGCPAE